MVLTEALVQVVKVLVSLNVKVISSKTLGAGEKTFCPQLIYVWDMCEYKYHIIKDMK